MVYMKMVMSKIVVMTHKRGDKRPYIIYASHSHNLNMFLFFKYLWHSVTELNIDVFTYLIPVIGLILTTSAINEIHSMSTSLNEEIMLKVYSYVIATEPN